MKSLEFFLAASLALAACTVQAQDKIEGLSPNSRTAVDLFDTPGAAQPLRKATLAELGLPLPIQESKASYHRVAIGDQTYWIKGVNVRILRDSTGNCATKKQDAQQTIATPSLGKHACK